MTSTPNARPGFTLIEIVIAVSIMALIMMLVVPGVYTYLRNARVKAAKFALANINNAIQVYQSDVHSYPTTLSDLKTRPLDEKAAKRWEGPYLEKELADPWGSEFVYTLNPKGTQPPYELYSWGPSKEGSPQEEWISVQE
jgi:general secretion pathway protein G